MRELNVRLSTSQQRRTHAPWAETFLFLASFLAMFGGSAVMLGQASVLLG